MTSNWIVPGVVNIRDCPHGWERDPRYVYIGRAGHGHDGRWGNEHVVGWCRKCKRVHERGDAVKQHWVDMVARCAADSTYRASLEVLRVPYLVCFCRPLACHGDNYIAILAQGAP